VAERERERAHDSQAVGDSDHLGGLLGDARGERGLEREDLDLLPRHRRVELLIVQASAAAAHGRPLLAGAEVVDVAEEDVVHRLTVGDRHRDREEGDAPLGVERAVDRVDDDPKPAVAG